MFDIRLTRFASSPEYPEGAFQMRPFTKRARRFVNRLIERMPTAESIGVLLKEDSVILASARAAESWAQDAERQRMIVWRHTKAGAEASALVSRVDIGGGKVWMAITTYGADGQILTVEDLPTNPLTLQEADQFARQLEYKAARAGRELKPFVPKEPSVVELVRGRKTAVAWIVQPRKDRRWYGILYTPDDTPLRVLTRAPKKELRRILEEVRAEGERTGYPLHIVEGYDGLAAVDPHWDGRDTVMCDSPTCDALHDAHENVALNVTAGC